jgi:hypothetical protein
LPAYTAKVSFSNGYVVVFKRSHILILIWTFRQDKMIWNLWRKR